MEVKDKIKAALIFYKRTHRKKTYSIIMFICCVITMVVLILGTNLTIILKDTFNKISYKTYFVGHSLENRDDIENLIDKILKIDHIVDAGEGSFNIDGKITLPSGYNSGVFLERRTPDNLPYITYGRKFNKDETNTIICPLSFTQSSSTIIKEKINMKDFLDKEIEFRFDIYKFNINDEGFEEILVDSTHTEKFTLVGVFKNTDDEVETDTCLINTVDSNSIFKQQYSEYLNMQNNYYKSVRENGMIPTTTSLKLFVVIDSNDNYDEVEKSLHELGVDSIRRNLTIDKNFFLIAYSSLIIMLTISLFTIIVLNNSYVKKKMLSEEKNIKLMLVEGFSKRDVGTIYFLETLIRNGVIFGITTLLSLIAYIIASNELVILLMFNFKLGIMNYLLTFIISVVLPGLIFYIRIQKEK